MTPALPSRWSARTPTTHRYRLSRAGILNVWQYDEQVFTFADGRMLLRGANGAGKSKTLEMLLPFALDGDKARLTASAKHHTSLLWLMTDGVDAGNRVGYVWVEFARTTAEGEEAYFTCGVGLRASSSARSATAWHFTADQRVGIDFSLEDAAGPLPHARLREVLGADRVFDRAADYKAHVGQALFGLDARHYDEVLRLLYWLRQPQVGEDIEPARLTQQLSQALPQLDEQAVRAAADTFDELTAFGEQIDRRATAAAALTSLAQAYAEYARAVLAARARSVMDAVQEEGRLRGALHRVGQTLADVEARQDATRETLAGAVSGAAADEARLATLLDSPEYRDQRRLGELRQQARRDAELAEEAARRAQRARESADRSGTVLTRVREELAAAVDQLATGVRVAGESLRRSVPGAALPTVLGSQLLSEADDPAPAVSAGLDQLAAVVHAAVSTVTLRRAAVGVVREALTALSQSHGRQATAEREAERAEARWEEARRSRVDAETDADRHGEALLGSLGAWVAHPDAPPVELPAELTAMAVAGLGRLAAQSAAPHLADLRDGVARSGALAHRARQELDRLSSERIAVEAERDPAPPSPALPRTARPDGAALWQVVDFAGHLEPRERAGLEAALQASGLLDAWLRPGGRLLDAGLRDVVLAAHPAASSHTPTSHTGISHPIASSRQLPTLAEALVVDLPEVSDVSLEDVAGVLRGIALVEQGAGVDPGGPDQDGPVARIGTDGSWRLGPAHGRAEKEVAQYVGATARAQERVRRLAVLDQAIAQHQGLLDASERERADLEAGVTALEAWVESVPTGRDLLAAWQLADLLLQNEQREELGNQRAQSTAQAARAESLRAAEVLRQVAAEHDLPAEATALDAVEEALRRLTDDLRDLEREVPHAHRSLAAWARAHEDDERSRQALELEQAAADDARRHADVAAAAFEELRTSVGDSVAELDRRIDAARRSLEEHARTVRTSRAALEVLLVELGQARTGVETARERLAEHSGERTHALASLAEAAGVAGLPAAADLAPQAVEDVLTLDSLDASARVPRASLAVVRDLAALSDAELPPLTTRLYERYGSATSGPAAEHQPAMATFGELHTVSGRDEAGEAPVTVLARRVTAGVERDRELLTQRERDQFERHVLGELGETLRRCRRDAQELVEAMNTQLSQVSTSQGIRVRLDWRLRDDVAAEAREAVDLLTQPVGALLPEERTQLRDALHRLIEASRAERPELSYSEHLAAALDYRTWFAFTIRYTRPERPGTWDRLHRRSPLSQGEQKVLCYLPLFAAAAAHFTSLAGAAPHAPRLVLLDDAFPKIDVRTHPLLFGLLVQLDLDFVITSERLWGDHPSVPSLAIYEALRDPGQRGIAQYEYRWDGRTLESVG